MMFGKRKKQKKLVWFSCDPKLSGRVDVLFGVPIGVLFTLRCLELGEWINFGTMLSFVYLAVIIFGGLYRWLFRRGAVERTVVIGGFAQSMYRRLGRLYVPVGFAVSVVGFAALVLGLSLITGIEDDTFRGTVSHISVSLAWMLLVLLYRVVSGYVGFLQYERSPVASRDMIDWG